ncbi:MAG TPA: DNA-directed RNA polymerase subunit alpha [Patescibacteria group bacterium]|nr:DNA-directed RNA polymerase subunit alpha [Patescibacteria group bacterium]
MEHITVPKQCTITPKPETGGHTNEVVISPCYPGYGPTIANALRRVLLSSLPGWAPVAVKIRGVQHEFSTIEHVKEDVVEMLMNVKRLRVKAHSQEQHTLSLSVSGKKNVTAADFERNPEVEIGNPELSLATLTHKDAKLDMDVYINFGVGYVPVEQQKKDDYDIGVIAVDAFYSPVKHVGYVIENIRVGKRTDFDKILFTLVTDGTLDAREALQQASTILVGQFQAVLNITTGRSASDQKEGEDDISDGVEGAE